MCKGQQTTLVWTRVVSSNIASMHKIEVIHGCDTYKTFCRRVGNNDIELAIFTQQTINSFNQLLEGERGGMSGIVPAVTMTYCVFFVKRRIGDNQ